MDIHAFALKAAWEKTVLHRIEPYWRELCDKTDYSVPFFVEEKFYRSALEMAEAASGEILSGMAEVAAVIKKDRSIARFASMLHYGFFLSAENIPLSVLPEPEIFFGQNAGLFQLLIALSSLPLIKKKYSAMGIPEEYVKGAALWIGGTVPIYAAAHKGIPGHTAGQTYWLRYHVEGKLFRIGRLEFLMGTMPDWMPEIYRNINNGEITVLARDKWEYDSCGCRFPADRAAFTASLQIKNGIVSGTPVNEHGVPDTGAVVELDTALWQPLCTAMELLPSVHIPGGGGLTPERVRDSLKKAFVFFRKYFKTDVKAFVCNSWLLNTVWQTELPESNIAEFQKIGRMCGQENSSASGLFFVYGRDDADPVKEPAYTSLHKAFRNQFLRGDVLRSGTALFLPEKGNKS